MINLERLYFLREEAELTQEQMGKIIGTKKYSVCNWENNKEIISLDKLNAYSNYFNVDMDYLLGLSNIKKNNTENIELNKKDIGNRLKLIRKKLGMTQRQFAELLNTTHSVIWSYEKGKNLILTAFIYEIAKKINISVDYICCKKNDSNIK